MRRIWPGKSALQVREVHQHQVGEFAKSHQERTFSQNGQNG